MIQRGYSHWRGLVLLFAAVFAVTAQAHDPDEIDDLHEDPDVITDIDPMGCVPANASQLNQVRLGNQKAGTFLNKCLAATGQSPWCAQLMRPNPSSVGVFRCTYGYDLPHQLIHPTESTWNNAIQAVRLITELEAKNICVELIYNWWRPEPYNKNVGGAAGRHPFGTSVDVRFCSKSDMERGFRQLCSWRKQGRLRAVGYYNSSSLHFGVGDRTGNTWGKACP